MAEVVLGMGVHRNALTRMEIGAHGEGLELRVGERDDINQALRLGAVVGVVVLAGMHLQADVLLEVTHLGSIEGQLIPA